MLLLADTPRAKAARLLRCDEKSLASMLNYWVSDAVSHQDLESVKRLAIDETSRLRGHDYVTVVVDPDERRVIDVEPGRKKDAISSFANKLEERGGSRDAIVAVTTDMSTSYMPAVAENFPNAVNIIDKFHIKQALDKARKEELEKPLKQSKPSLGAGGFLWRLKIG